MYCRSISDLTLATWIEGGSVAGANLVDPPSIFSFLAGAAHLAEFFFSPTTTCAAVEVVRTGTPFGTKIASNVQYD